MTQEQLMEQAEFLRDQQREDGIVLFTGKYFSFCCDALMDQDYGRCPECMECCEAVAEVLEPERTPEELLATLNKARAEMKEMGL